MLTALANPCPARSGGCPRASVSSISIDSMVGIVRWPPPELGMALPQTPCRITPAWNLALGYRLMTPWITTRRSSWRDPDSQVWSVRTGGRTQEDCIQEWG